MIGASDLGEGCFVHGVIYLLAGRSEAQKRQLTHALGHTLRQYLPTVDSITVNIIDVVRETYAKDSLC